MVIVCAFTGYLRDGSTSNYAALTYSSPTAHDAPTSLQAFTEEELMLKDTGKPLMDLPLCAASLIHRISR